MATTIDGSLSLYSSSSSSSTSSTSSNSDISKDAFLQILVAKLSNQDPLSPTDDTEFLGELAQFSALEQMQNLNETQTMSQAFDLVGKYVIAEHNSSYITGRVDGVIYDEGELTFDIGGYQVSIDDIKEVLAEALTTDDKTTDSTTTDETTSETN
ncbi:MAG: flagellar hook capping protein [Clostridia bacterium]|nr:flagellar hook capping protein [Clostridia bacterium]